eukprot:TRINITY_DN2003_c0_g1_i1.p2 TRINITY_DN2003_c0_g1~~TRINITY_DN2003_c0_g1_i1.p2  ORF type:complete len:163 (+),score=7.42 TRINITY_DN2003_c0_g1_i1:62-550(+)
MLLLLIVLFGLLVRFLVFFFLMIRRPPRSTHCISSAASDVYKRQVHGEMGFLHIRFRNMDHEGQRGDQLDTPLQKWNGRFYQCRQHQQTGKEREYLRRSILCDRLRQKYWSRSGVLQQLHGFEDDQQLDLDYRKRDLQQQCRLFTEDEFQYVLSLCQLSEEI